MRKGMSSQLARPAYYDRNPASVGIGYSATNIAPHALTTRASYTVPAARKAFVESVYLTVIRTTAATTAGEVALQLNGPGSLIEARRFQQNAVGDQWQSLIGSVGALVAGNTESIVTSDGSVGGAYEYLSFGKVYEFDA